MANLSRKEGESDGQFRWRQKYFEVLDYLELVDGDAFEDFAKSELWKRNKAGNLVFSSILTIFPSQYGGKFAYNIGGGQPPYGEDIYWTEEEAMRAMWDHMQRIRKND